MRSLLTYLYDVCSWASSRPRLVKAAAGHIFCNRLIPLHVMGYISSVGNILFLKRDCALPWFPCQNYVSTS
jgi:hypothetical protein